MRQLVCSSSLITLTYDLAVMSANLDMVSSSADSKSRQSEQHGDITRERESIPTFNTSKYQNHEISQCVTVLVDSSNTNRVNTKQIE